MSVREWLRAAGNWAAGWMPRPLDRVGSIKLKLAVVLPVADRLPDVERAAIADVIRARLSSDSWQGWNYARATARR